MPQKFPRQKNKFLYGALRFNNVLLIPKKPYVLQRDVDVNTKLTDKINLEISIISAAMDTVSEKGSPNYRFK
jgi:IMP dehydrogenase